VLKIALSSRYALARVTALTCPSSRFFRQRRTSGSLMSARARALNAGPRWLRSRYRYNWIVLGRRFGRSSIQSRA